MKREKAVSLITLLCFGLLSLYPTQEDGRAQAANPAAKISVLNPLGNPPPITRIPMAPRPSTLEGKTIYFVDDGFLGGDILLKEMIAWFAKNMPQVKTEFRKKAGGFTAEDPPLWAEIKEKGDAMVMATGH
jgi:hypothetical protein